MLIFNLISLVKLSILSVDYTSYITKSITDGNTNKIVYTKNLLNLENDKFVMSPIVSHNTIFNPLEMSEIGFKYKNTILKENDGFFINSYESKISINDLNGQFLSILNNSRNLVVSVRDYYDTKQNEELFRTLNTEKDTLVSILPASLSVVTELYTENINPQFYCIISTVGLKTVCNIYEVTNSEKGVFIKNVHMEELENFGDSHFDQVIDKHVRQSLEARDDPNLVLVPYLTECKPEDTDFILDITDICLEIKKNLSVDLVMCPTEEVFAINKDLKKPIENLLWNIKEIKEDFKELVEKEEVNNFTKIVTDLCQKYDISKKLLISSYNGIIIEDLINMNDLVNVQEHFILKGALKYHKSNLVNHKMPIKSDDKRVIVKRSYPMTSPISKLEDEIKTKYECIKIIKDIKSTEGKFFLYLPDNILDTYKEFINSGYSVNNLKLQEAKRFLETIQKLINQNKRAERDVLTRPNKISKLKEVIEKVLKIKESRPEVWNNTLEKKYEECIVFLDINKENNEILGEDFEEKAYSLEGILGYSIKLYDDKKKAELKEKEAKKEELKEKEELQKDDEKEEEKEKVIEEKEVKEDEKVIEEKEDENKDNDNKKMPFDFSKLDPKKIEALQREFNDYIKNGNLDDMLKDFDNKKHNEDHKSTSDSPLVETNRDL